MDKWNKERDDFLRNNFESMSHEQMAQILDSTRPAVRNRCWRLGLRKKEPTWSNEDIDKLQALCKVPNMTDAEIAKVMGRSKAGISLKISRYGFSGSKVKTGKPKRQPKYATKEERRKAFSEAIKKRYAEKGHPRGSLGMKHTEETKRILSEKAKAWNSSQTEEQKQERIVKAMKTMVANGTQFTERKNASWKAGWHEIGGIRKYYRSNWEANYAYYLQWLKDCGHISDWLHEPVTFWFEGIKRGTVSYLPDFWVKEKDGSEAYHEVKGWMDDRSKTKIARMAKYHPNVKLIVIDGKAYHELRKKVSSIVPGWTDVKRDNRGL